MGGELKVFGASEHNLREVDVTFGPGLTAVVGVSGSGKSSLVFDVVYTEARRRFIESFALGRPAARVPAAHVRGIYGLAPAVAIAQNVLNVNPASTVASSTGIHPFLRILYARFADISCPDCGVPVRSVSGEERLALALDMLATAGSLEVEVAVVRGLRGTHGRLLAGLRGQFDAVTVDGRPWAANRSSRVPRLARRNPTTLWSASPRCHREHRRRRFAPHWSAQTRWAHQRSVSADCRCYGRRSAQAARRAPAARAVRVCRPGGGHVIASHRRRHDDRVAGVLGG